MSIADMTEVFTGAIKIDGRATLLRQAAASWSFFPSDRHHEMFLRGEAHLPGRDEQCPLPFPRISFAAVLQEQYPAAAVLARSLQGHEEAD